MEECSKGEDVNKVGGEQGPGRAALSLLWAYKPVRAPGIIVSSHLVKLKPVSDNFTFRHKYLP